MWRCEEGEENKRARITGRIGDMQLGKIDSSLN